MAEPKESFPPPLNLEGLPSGVLTGSTLAARYRIFEPIGRGGMATVFDAWDNVASRRVAVKVLHSHLQLDRDVLVRFDREIHAVSQFAHRNVVTATDCGFTSEGVPYLVMERLFGRSLRSRIDEHRSAIHRFDNHGLAEPRALRIIGGVLDGLGHIHAHGYAHRDLKPDNIIVDEDDDAKLLDFGLTLLIGEPLRRGRADITPIGTAMGTPAYASPEQVRGDRDVSYSTDIHAAAVLLFEMLTGSLPYHAATFEEQCRRILDGEPSSVRSFRRDVSDRTEQVIAQALRKNPLDRFESAHAMKSALGIL